ncbi:MAG TPA: cation diffusion facilitator family transporter [Candidatus Acidoferrales bacterium]|nr:cation diffusion facilitator family transporter [Candidatus Acidoferrales bacterium]
MEPEYIAEKSVFVEKVHVGRPLLYSILLNGLITVVELIGGILSGSLALISDAMHNFSDFIALIISLIASRMMDWAGNTKKSYGYFRFEILAAFINSVLLVLIGIYIIYEALARFRHPVHIDSVMMLIVAIVGLAANLSSVLLLRKHRRENLNIKSAFLHLITDTLESGAVIVTAAIITFIKFSSLDLIMSVVIGVFIIKSSWDLLLESTNILTEGSPRGIDLNEVGSFIKDFPGVKGVHHLHIWSLSSNFRALSAHIVVDDMQLSRTIEITWELEQQLAARFSIDHPTFQLETRLNQDCGEELIPQYKDGNRRSKTS